MSELVIVGNPNTGKTTLFNTLTKSNNHVGNWHGVTVDIAQKEIKHNNKKIKVYDLPGIYALQDFSEEEKVATSFLKEHKDDVIINICDANNLSRNLLLSLQLLEAGHKVVLAVNMAKEVKNLDYEKLEKLIGVPVVPIDARKKKSADVLLETVSKVIDKFVIPRLPYLGNLAQDYIKNNGIRFDYIDNIISQIYTTGAKIYGQAKLDKILFNKFLALPIFLLVLFLVFVITFGAIGTNFSVIVEDIFNYFSEMINNFLCKLSISAWAHSLIMNGAVAGIGVVVGFLPQVVLLFLCFNFLEDIGYLSRVAVMFDPFLKKVGLTGKSLFSLIMGFGCSTTAMLTTRSLDSLSLKKRTAMVVPFASCGAKLPVYALICSAFFQQNKALMVFLMYVLGLVVGLIVSAIASKITNKKPEQFVMEIPPLRIPTVKKILQNILTNVFGFIKRVGGTLVISSVVVWILLNINFSLQYVSSPDDSILYSVCKEISIIFKPLGFESPAIVVALFIGIIAKEMIISFMSIANGVVGNLSVLAASLTLSTSTIYFSKASALAFLVFVLLYSPCISSLSVTAKEISRRFSLFLFVFQFAIAYFCSFVSYTIARLAFAGKIIEPIIIAVVLALVVFVVIKYLQKKYTNCKTCKGNYCGNTCMQKGK